MKELIEKRNDLLEEMEGLVKVAETETRVFSDEEVTKVAEIKEEIRKIDETIKATEEIRNLEKIEERSEVKDMENKELELRELEGKLVNFINTGDTRALSVGANGALIPEHISARIIEKVRDLSPIYAKATVHNVGGDLKFVKDNDDLEAQYIDDMVEAPEGTMTFSTATLKNFIINSLVVVSKSLLNRSDFDLVSHVVNSVAKAIARKLEKELINGTTGKMRGLANSTNTVTTSAVGAISIDDLIDAQMAVPQVYQADACWIMNLATLKTFRKMKDSDGKYILGTALDGFGYVLLGKPVYVTESAPAIATGKKPIFYGDMSGLYVKLAQNVEIEILKESYAKKHAVGVIAYVECDSEIVEEQKIVAVAVK